MNDKPEGPADGVEHWGHAERRLRADAQRSLDALLSSAKVVFASSGVDAPVREIAERAGVGVGTFYRHFPQRADLIAAVFRQEIDTRAEVAPILAASNPPCGRFFCMQSQACACLPKMTIVRTGWSLSSSTDSAAACTHRGKRLPGGSLSRVRGRDA